MNEITNTFEGQNLRAILQDGEPWFIAVDVCAALDIVNNRDAISKLDSDEKGVAIADTLGGPQEVLTVNESGLYSLIFTSRKEEAKKFRKWVTKEVLPSIRKTGTYRINTKAPLASLQATNLELALDVQKLAYTEESLRLQNDKAKLAERIEVETHKQLMREQREELRHEELERIKDLRLQRQIEAEEREQRKIDKIRQEESDRKINEIYENLKREQDFAKAARLQDFIDYFNMSEEELHEPMNSKAPANRKHKPR